jgi:hypothetical protein
MHYSRDELMLFRRCGVVPPASRPGPSRRRVRLRANDPGQVRPAAEPPVPWLLGLAASVLGSAATRPVPRSEAADRETYLELEFAVGFGAEDESWL